MADEGMKTADVAELPLEGIETCAEIFVDGIQGAVATGPVFKINLFSVRMDTTAGHPRKFAAATLIIPASAAAAMANFIKSMADDQADVEGPAGAKVK